MPREQQSQLFARRLTMMCLSTGLLFMYLFLFLINEDMIHETTRE